MLALCVLYVSLAVVVSCFFFFFNDTATTEIYTLSLHDALPILIHHDDAVRPVVAGPDRADFDARSEEHTSELQSQSNLVCRLLLEKKNQICTAPCNDAPARHAMATHSSSARS